MLAMFTIVAAVANAAPPQHCLFDTGDHEVEPEDPSIAVDQCYPSPDARFIVKVRDGRITVIGAGGSFPAGTMDGGRILWSPTSRGFAVADSEGSGETEVFRYVEVMWSRPKVNIRLRRTAVARFKAVYGCHGAGAYANTITAGWTSRGYVRLVVQDGVHSEGCYPGHGDTPMIGIIGNPATGRILRQLAAVDISREWCTAAQRAQYGYCYDKAAFIAAHKKASRLRLRAGAQVTSLSAPAPGNADGSRRGPPNGFLRHHTPGPRLVVWHSQAVKFAVTLLALWVAAGPAQAQTQAPQPAPGDGFHVEQYAVSLRPDPETKTVSGAETIIVTSTSDGLSRLAFSSNALTIVGAKMDGGPVDISSTPDKIVFTLPHPLAKGQKAKLHFDMSGMPARGFNVSAGGVYTSYFACDWMVCLQDAPGDKADFALDLDVPAGWTTIGVGQALRTQVLPGGVERHRWRSTRPYSAYLYAFAAGPFPTRLVHTAEGQFVYLNATGTVTDMTQLLSQTPAIARFFADKAGEPLPDQRYMQVLVPGDEAQEAAGFSLIGQAQLDRDRADPATAWVVAHELAHQWWGNLVTCASWRDLWLGEGVTVFMVAAWHQHQDGDAAYQAALDVARARLERARQAGFDKPLAWEGKYPSLGIRRAIQYSKGALFLATLRDEIGDDAFWNGLRLFTRQYSGRTATSHDFQVAMEAASGKDLMSLFNKWVYGDEASPY